MGGQDVDCLDGVFGAQLLFDLLVSRQDIDTIIALCGSVAGGEDNPKLTDLPFLSILQGCLSRFLGPLGIKTSRLSQVRIRELEERSGRRIVLLAPARGEVAGSRFSPRPPQVMENFDKGVVRARGISI